MFSKQTENNRKSNILTRKNVQINAQLHVVHVKAHVTKAFLDVFTVSDMKDHMSISTALRMFLSSIGGSGYAACGPVQVTIGASEPRSNWTLTKTDVGGRTTHEYTLGQDMEQDRRTSMYRDTTSHQRCAIKPHNTTKTGRHIEMRQAFKHDPSSNK